MKDRIRTLTIDNIDEEIALFEEQIKDIAIPSNMTGTALLQLLKRQPIEKTSYYSEVSYFEAANRIMTDMVILYGVKWLLRNGSFEFKSYTVEFGNENKRTHDIESEKSGSKQLVGEAFNVAPSFFQGKKSKMLNKLRSKTDAEYKFIVVNNDAVERGYQPKLSSDEYILLIDIFGDNSQLLQQKMKNA